MKTRISALLWALVALSAAARAAPGFVSLFDGKTLDGWQLVAKKGSGYIVENGLLVCPADGGGSKCRIRLLITQPLFDLTNVSS